MATFKQFNESTELHVVQVRPLKFLELRRTRQAVEAAIIIHDALQEQKLAYEQIKDLLKKLEPIKLPFVQGFVKEIHVMLKKHYDMVSAGKAGPAAGKIAAANAGEMKAAFLAGDKALLKKLNAKLKANLDSIDHHIDLPARATAKLKSTFTATPSFFGTTSLLADISDREYEKLRHINFDKEVFTGIDFPMKKADDFHYVLFYLLNLTNSPKPIRITDTHQFRTHSRVAHANGGELDKLLRITREYLHSNDKSLIPVILSLVNKIPTIKAANETAKRKIKTLYRGVPGDDLSEKEVISRDRKSKYVATSDSRRAAMNFALQKGHLEGEESRRSEIGYVIKYEVSPEAILFDTKVIDTAYNESEIVIDATKAVVKDVEEV